MQLEQEIKMSKMQAQQQQQLRGPRNAFGREPVSDKKKDEVIGLYERLTNISILNVEHPVFNLHNLPQTYFKCLYTVMDDPTAEPTGNEPCTYPLVLKLPLLKVIY